MSGAAPRALALLGDPVEHSLSPAIHQAAFDALGLDARYVALRTLDDELPHLIRVFARSGGGNVTVPHKIAARELLDRESPEVRVTGSCNCFWAAPDGSLHGDNTDVEGFRRAVEAWSAGPSLPGARILLLGAGGGARAVAAACIEAGVALLDIRNRTAERARDLARQFADHDTAVRALPWNGDRGPSGQAESRYDLVVNATSLGLEEGDALPLDLTRVRTEAAFDLVYGADGTRWTRHAEAKGIPAIDGREMLLHQAGLSLRRWFDVDPPLLAMRDAAARGLDR